MVKRQRLRGFFRGCSAMILPLLLTVPAIAKPQSTVAACIPVRERAAREYGCYVLSTESIGQLNTRPAFWHLSTFATPADAENIRGTVVEAFGGVWLMTLAEPGWRPPRGRHVAEIGPLPVSSGVAYTARYMEAVFRPGMKTAVHRHPGPEAWYTLSGQMCLETPDGAMNGSAGGQPVIVAPGLPMELTATGTEVRRALVLVLHDSAKPPSAPAPDWTPKGLCRR